MLLKEERRTKVSVSCYWQRQILLVKSHWKSNNEYKQDEIIEMRDCLLDNICVLFGARAFQQTIGIPIGMNCAPLLTDLFLHVYEADFLQGLLKNRDRKLAKTFNSSFPYI